MSFFLTHLLLKVVSPIIFLPSPFRCHDLQETNDSIDEEDLRPTIHMEPLHELWNPTPQGHWIEDSKKIRPEMQEKALGF